MVAILELTTTDMHTGGEPVRIVIGGYPPIAGATLLDKRRHVAAELDHLRRALMWEPRGHAEMYGVIRCRPDHPDADLAVLFMHNEGYSTMCGHATIALGRWALDEGIIAADGDTARLRLQVPAGLVDVTVDVATGAASYRSTPSFLHTAGQRIEVEGREVDVDVAYGGAFYALVGADQLGVDLSDIDATRRAAWAVTEALAKLELDHPDADDLAFLYGTIVTDGGDGAVAPSHNVCIFAERQVDRSPTGSGVQARMAAMHARGAVSAGEPRRFASVTGAEFSGRIVSEIRLGSRSAVVVEVSGQAHYTGRHTFLIEDDDPIEPFLVR